MVYTLHSLVTRVEFVSYQNQDPSDHILTELFDGVRLLYWPNQPATFKVNNRGKLFSNFDLMRKIRLDIQIIFRAIEGRVVSKRS